MANELTSEAVGGPYDARSLRGSIDRSPRRRLAQAWSTRVQRLIARTRLPYSARAVELFGLLWLVGMSVAVLWDFLPAL